MFCHRKIGKWICNGSLLLITILLLALCLLNLVNPSLPPIQCEGTKLIDPTISHKYNGDTISMINLLSIVFLIPLAQILVTELLVPLRTISNDYSYNSTPTNITATTKSSECTSLTGRERWKHGTMYAFRWYRDYLFGSIFMLLVNDIGKSTINSPRPHFLDSCKPNFTMESCHSGWVDNYECTNQNISRWKLADSRKSFPSGHAALSMFSAVFMILYQHRRLSMERHGNIVVLWCHLSWIAWGFFCTLSRVADHRHHPIDIIVGGIIGVLGALYTVVFLCKNFYDRLQLIDFDGVVPKSCSTSTGGILNGSAVVLDGFDGYFRAQTTNLSNGSILNNSNMHGNGKFSNSNGEVNRPSLRRLISNQSTMTTMSEIPEDSNELEQI